MLRLRPSSAPRWVPCPGSASMEARYPGEDSQAAREGTAAHWVAAEALNYWLSFADTPRPTDHIGETAPNGIVITDEMAEAAAVYVDDVLGIVRPYGLPSALIVEQSVSIDSVLPGHSGTPDARAVIADTLYIWDFKFGWGIVEAFENWQLLDYAIGVIDSLRISGHAPPPFIEFRIVQPRPYHWEGPVRSWRIEARELEVYCKTLAVSAARAVGDEPPCESGAHCCNCSAAHACPALSGSVSQLLEYVGRAIPSKLSADEMGRELEILNLAEALLKARKSGVEAQAEARIIGGEELPGWWMKPGRGSRAWNGTDEEILALGQLAGADLSRNTVMSPAQAETAGVNKKLVASMVINKPGKLKLTRKDKTAAARVFGRK